jgi:exonuclease SbcC
MNLVSLEICDYRQYQGVHRFEPRQQSMVAIIGHNGAGKTTLFEAIEWCLYNPRHISNEDIQPRVYRGRPRVKVTLEHPGTGEQFEIERELKGKSVTAAVYRSSQPDVPVVQGTRQVSDYVARHLLGLSKDAFIATFFTRQKELSFFGSHKPAERRRAVGRLLGLETVRLAQESIGEQRLEKQNEAKIKLQLFDSQSEGVDFEALRNEARAAIEERTRALAVAEETAAAIAAEHEQARAELHRLQQRAQEHAALALQESTLTGTARECSAQIEAANETLSQIDAAAAELQAIAPTAAREPELALAVEVHEREKENAEKIADLNRQLAEQDEAEQRLRQSVAEVAQIIEGGPIARRVIFEASPAAIGEDIDRLRAAARSVDVPARQREVDDLQHARQHADEADRDDAQLRRFQKAVGELHELERALLANGDPELAVAGAVQEKERHRGEASIARATATSLGARLETLAALRQRLSGGQFAEDCPTCGRPFEKGELDGYLTTISEQIAELDRQVMGQESTAAKAETLASEAAGRETEARNVLSELQTIRARLAASGPHIAEAEEAVRRSREQLASIFARLRRSDPPRDDEIASARQALRDAQEKASRIPLLDRLHADLSTIERRRASLGATLDGLGTSRYDPDQHLRDRAEFQAARDAAAKTAMLQQRLDQRPAALSRIAEAENRIRQTESDREMVRQQLLALDFRSDALDLARAAETACQARLSEAASEKHRAESNLAEARKCLEEIDARERQLLALRDDSIAAKRAADDLDRMYREFTRFEQHVARSVTPALADLTSQLVAAVTDGKYDRIEFTEDFGIEVYDGPDDRFPMSQFSGGERDVITLCARLALSQFVGGQAQSPLQFVVMDEVFGSLDRTRRENLMETLQKLIEDSGTFRQLFVISHVDDVQFSPAFDEVWRVVETGDGISRLEQITTSALPEDL